jgi:TusA-related sulfurtransferase/peroxiredoxin family protein
MSTVQDNTVPDSTLLDWRGLKGPEAIVNTARAVKRLEGRPGLLRILADDDAFPTDLASWCRVTRSQLLHLEQEPSGAFAALVRVNGAHDATRPVERYEVLGQHGNPNGSLDCRGMLCPQPILELARAMRTLQAGSTIEVLADDPAFPMDVQGWCRSTGTSLASLDERDGVYRAVIYARERNEPRPAESVHSVDTVETHTLRDDVMVRVPPAPRATPRAPAAATVPALPVPSVMPPAAPPTALAAVPTVAVPAVLTATPRVALPTPPLAALAATRATGLEPTQPAWPADAGIRVDLGGVLPEELASVLDSLGNVPVEGGPVTVTGLHPQFARDVMDWCGRGGHALMRLETSGTPMMAIVRLRQGASTALAPAVNAVATTAGRYGCALLVVRSDMEAVLTALLTANTAASSGMPASILFAFWGINVLRGDRPRRDVPREKVSLVQRVLKWIMPAGPRRQRLGKLSFGGAGGLLVRFLMKRRKLLLVEDLMQQAVALNVRFLVCTMSMSVMGVTRRELMDLPNLELGGIASFVDDARGAGINLVF